MEALGLNLKWFIFQAVDFAVLLFVLNRFLHKPLMALLDRRRQEALDAQKNAEEVRKALAETEERQKAILAEAQASAQSLLDQAREQAAAVEARLKKDAQDKADGLLATAEKDIALARTRMRGELQSELAGMVVEATEKVLGTEVPATRKKKSLGADVKEVK